ncbi:hypothetical protein KAT80_02140 [Candidatus Pacearchaeota archaeon]|nr:hypothetical protein [Candidatus Pacearchaeota archaeon]
MRNRKKSRRSRYHKPKRNRKPSTLKKLNWFTKRHPIATGIILIFASIVLFRLSFTNAFLSSSEVFMWAIILSIGIFLIGLFVLICWWRNNVSMLTTRHNVNWRNR